MKKSLRNSILLLLTAMLLTVSALADSGPKAQLTVKVENAPSEPYYLDLLEKGDYQGHTYGSGDGDDTYSGLDWSYSEEEIAALDDELLDALRAAVPEGWHACTAQGTNGAPMWGDLIGSDAGGVRLHSFRYHGVPDTYRIILVTKSGESWVSGVLHRATLQSSATVDWAARTANAPSPAMAYALQFLCTLLPTLLIEGLLLFAFGYRSKRSWLVFLLVNLVTQGGFAVYLAVTVLNHGVSGWSLIFYIPIEVIITLVELLLYRRLLTEKNKARAAVYAIAANLCSAVFGLWLIDPLWHFIVLGLLGGFMLFGGVMKLLEEAGAVRALVRWLKRPLRWVFGSQAGEDALGATALNLSANMLGMGNAATPMGLRAARLLQPAGQIAASAPLCMLLVINATSVQLYPSSVIAMRYAAGSAAPEIIVLPTLVASTAATAVGMAVCWLCERKRRQ